MSEFNVIVPDGVCGEWRVESFTVSEQESSFTRIRAAMGRPNEYVNPGTYKRLMRGNTVVMSNTDMEYRTNLPLIYNAKGRVLINGLGLGAVLHAILKNKLVTEVWVIEKHDEVIKLVGPSFANDGRVKIIHADALEYQPPVGVKFDAVWHDIWDYICADNIKDMRKLHRKYGRRAAWQASWERDSCERQSRRWA